MPRVPKRDCDCHSDCHYPVSASEDVKLLYLENKLVPKDLSNELTATAVSDATFLYIDDSGVAKRISATTLLAQAKAITFKVVDELPTTGQQTNVIYLKKITTSEPQNVYEEYIWVNIGTEAAPQYAWEKIGATSIDLSAYASKQWVESKGYLVQADIASKADKTYVDEKLTEKATVESVNALSQTVTTISSNLTTEITDRSAADQALSTRINVYEENKAQYDDAVAKKHEHNNKTLLDGVEAKNLLSDAQIAEINKVQNKADTTYVDEKLNLKQDKVIAGKDISITDGKTINALDQAIREDFETLVTVGNLPAGTHITEEMTLREILYRILYNKVPVTGISLDKTSMSIDVNYSDTLTATISPATATNKNTIWSSSDESIVSIEGTSMVTRTLTGKAQGTATITVKSAEDQSISASCPITVVYHPVTSVTLNKTSGQLPIGGTETLIATVLPANATNKNVTWSSSDTSKATVDQTGKIVAIAPGNVNIIVKSVDNPSISATYSLQVNKIPVQSVTLNKTSAELAIGEVLNLVATVLPEDATYKTVRWESSNSSVATVSNGNVTAVSSGTATIKAIATDDETKYGACTITVKSGSLEVKYGGAGIYADETAYKPNSDYLAIWLDNDISRMTTTPVTEAELLSINGYTFSITIAEDIPSSLEYGEGEGQYASIIIPVGYKVTSFKGDGALPFAYKELATGQKLYFNNQTYTGKGLTAQFTVTVQKES